MERKYSKTFISGYLRMITSDFSSLYSSGGCTASIVNIYYSYNHREKNQEIVKL